MYFSGQGKVSIATRPATGDPVTFVEVGNASLFKLAPATAVKDHKESQTGQRIIDQRLITEKKISVSIELEELSVANLDLLFYGTDDTTGTSPAVPTVHMFSTAVAEKWVKFDGWNTAHVNSDGSFQRIVVELFKVFFDPSKDFSILSDDFAKFPVEGMALYDASRAATAATLGGFGRVLVYAAT